jgi:hypothetical protein
MASYQIYPIKKAVLSGDIIASTSLNIAAKEHLEEKLKELIDQLKREYKIFGRLIKGDYIECALPDAEEALRFALVIKCFVKSIASDNKLFAGSDKRSKFFKTHGIRLAIGYGELERYDPLQGVMDGEAIYLSGRKISSSGTYKKERVIIKNSLYFVSTIERYNKEFEPLLMLIDHLISKGTARQCEVLMHKLLGKSEEEIGQLMNIAQPVVNQHSTSIGWNAIEKAVQRFNDVIKNQ